MPPSLNANIIASLQLGITKGDNYTCKLDQILPVYTVITEGSEEK